MEDKINKHLIKYGNATLDADKFNFLKLSQATRFSIVKDFVKDEADMLRQEREQIGKITFQYQTHGHIKVSEFACAKADKRITVYPLSVVVGCNITPTDTLDSESLQKEEDAFIKDETDSLTKALRCAMLRELGQPVLDALNGLLYAQEETEIQDIHKKYENDRFQYAIELQYSISPKKEQE